MPYNKKPEANLRKMGGKNTMTKGKREKRKRRGQGESLPNSNATKLRWDARKSTKPMVKRPRQKTIIRSTDQRGLLS